jgi:hypothetical protein
MRAQRGCDFDGEGLGSGTWVFTTSNGLLPRVEKHPAPMPPSSAYMGWWRGVGVGVGGGGEVSVEVIPTDAASLRGQKGKKRGGGRVVHFTCSGVSGFFP